MSDIKSICVVGLGYIGLPTAAVFARSGVQVHGFDVNAEAVEIINQGRAHIVEADLDGLLQKVVSDGTFKAATEPAYADAFIIAVPTPLTDDKRPDLSYVETASRTIAPYIRPGDLVILESTVPPGATEAMCRWIEQENPALAKAGGAGKAYSAAHCPERVLPGHVLVELMDNDRVIGGITPACSERARTLYQIFLRGNCLITNARTAEMTKLVENSFRDVNIAFANELSLISAKLDINVWQLISLANRHPRVNILQPGPGVGGHCISVDPWFIVDAVPDESPLVHMARKINDAKPEFVIDQALKAAEQFEKPVVACMGLAFKPNIDDLRSSPALAITQKLASSGQLKCLAVEPNIHELPESLADLHVELVDVDEAVDRADILVLLVDHREFQRYPGAKIKEKVIIDTRGLWRGAHVLDAGAGR